MRILKAVTDENLIEMMLEERAGDEMDARSENFCDWLMNNGTVRELWMAYRVNTATQQEREDIAR